MSPAPSYTWGMLTGPIPYIDIKPKVVDLPSWFPFIDSFTLHAFGPLVALGILLGLVSAMYFAKVKNINEKYLHQIPQHAIDIVQNKCDQLAKEFGYFRPPK